MRKRIMKAACICILLIFGICSCCPAEEDPMKKVLGHWVDVNGDTELDIDEKELVIRFGEWTETYPYDLEETEYMTRLVGRKPEGFGLLGYIELRPDGSLQSYEQILDDEGHVYRFVREEDLEEELKIKDLSKDLPKEIASDEITDFSLTFDRSLGYGLGDEWPFGYYSWEIEKEDDSWHMNFGISGSSYIVYRFSGEVSREYIRGLAGTLKEAGILQHNGYHMKNNVSSKGYYLYARYASGEKLVIRAEGTAAEKCVFDLPALLEYAKEQIGDELEDEY